MADYQLTATDSVIRTADGAVIPDDPANRDWVEYQEWLAAGGVPDPYVRPKNVIPTTDFIARFTNQEYITLAKQRAADTSASKVGFSKNWDIVVTNDNVDLNQQKVQRIKTDLVAAAVLTQVRADEIFS
jgi:hypothetical protein